MKSYVTNKFKYINEEVEGDSGVEDLCHVVLKNKEDLSFLIFTQNNQLIFENFLKDKEISKIQLFMKIVK